jgi:hypothetical protein
MPASLRESIAPLDRVSWGIHRKDPMAKPNYQYEKRQRELEKKKKKEEKALKKAAGSSGSGSADADGEGAPAAPDVPEDEAPAA